jgi:hypothetical protein
MIESTKTDIVEFGKWIASHERQLVGADEDTVKFVLPMRDRYVAMLAQSETNLKKLEAV